jgi:hypothetical protein
MTVEGNRIEGSQPAIRRATVRALAVLVVVGAGIAAVRGLESMLGAVFDKPPAPLTRPLPGMRTDLGARYRADGVDKSLDAEMIETLGTPDYLVRRYRDTTLEASAPGALLNLNVNYYATGTSTPHVPEICWAGSGMEEASASRISFPITGLKRKDGRGKLSDVTMRMISFVPPSGRTVNAKGEAIYCNVAYVFQVNGMYVTTKEEVTSLFWKASYRYAYHSKIEVTPLASGGGDNVLECTQAEAQRMIGDFMRAALPEVESCLPDPAILTEADKGTEAVKAKVN